MNWDRLDDITVGHIDYTVYAEVDVTTWGRNWSGDDCSYKRVERGYEGDGDKLFVEIPYTAHGDYSGSDVAHANTEWLRKEYEGDENVVIGRGGHYSEVVLMRVDDLDEEGWDDLDRLFDSLANYLVLDDETLSNYERELTEEWLDDYVSYAARCSDNLEHTSEVAIRALFWEGLYNDQKYEVIIEQAHECYIDEDRVTGYIVAELGIREIATETLELWELLPEVTRLVVDSGRKMIELVFHPDTDFERVRSFKTIEEMKEYFEGREKSIVTAVNNLKGAA